MTPQEKCDLVQANSGDLFPRLAKKATELANRKNGSFDQRIGQAYQIIDAMAAEVGNVAICKRGCNFCCYQSVLIPLWEARRIAKFSGRKMKNITGYGHDNDTPEGLRKRHSGTPCTFLHENGCAIYPVRPFACRLHFNMGDDATVCDIVRDPGAKVPYFNFEPAKEFMFVMFFRDSKKFGDIREFFGENQGIGNTDNE